MKGKGRREKGEGRKDEGMNLPTFQEYLNQSRSKVIASPEFSRRLLRHSLRSASQRHLNFSF
jgi:hypothetical protein